MRGCCCRAPSDPARRAALKAWKSESGGVLGQLQSVNKQLMPVADWAHEDDKAYARQKAVVKGGGKYVEETTTVTNRRGEEEEQVVLALVAPYDEVLAVAQAELQRFEDELADSFAGGPYGLDDIELLPTLRNSTCASRQQAGRPSACADLSVRAQVHSWASMAAEDAGLRRGGLRRGGRQAVYPKGMNEVVPHIRNAEQSVSPKSRRLAPVACLLRSAWLPQRDHRAGLYPVQRHGEGFALPVFVQHRPCFHHFSSHHKRGPTEISQQVDHIFLPCDSSISAGATGTGN